MGNTVQCRYCKKTIDKETAYKPVDSKSVYYCCENHYLSMLEKKKNNTKHSYKSAEGTDRRHYTDVLQDLYVNQYGWNKKRIQWQIIMSQTNNLLKSNPNWTYDTILYVIWYMQEILGMNLICAESNWSPLSLVDYYALDAEEYYNDCCTIAKSIENYNFDDEDIVVKSSKNQKIKYKLLSFEGD